MGYSSGLFNSELLAYASCRIQLSNYTVFDPNQEFGNKKEEQQASVGARESRTGDPGKGDPGTGELDRILGGITWVHW